MQTTPSFWPLLSQLRKGRFVDLTHAFDEHSPHFEGTDPLKIKDLSTYEETGIWVQRFDFEAGWGTHVDAPAHFCQGLRTVDQIELTEMLLPLVVIDVHTKAAQNPDYLLSKQDILSWEEQYGTIPEGAFVAMRTDWSKRWPSQEAMNNPDAEGRHHTPGWSLEALKHLYEQRLIIASGHETINTDSGLTAHTTHWACERYILSQNRYQIELMTNLDLCPPTGAVIICTFPKPKNGSAFPARLFAICPK